MIRLSVVGLNFPGELGPGTALGNKGSTLTGAKPHVRQTLLRDPQEEMSAFRLKM